MVALEHLMKTTVTCCEQRTRLFSIYLVSGRILFKFHINSSFCLITYSGQILSFQDPPCNPQAFLHHFSHLLDDSVLFSDTNHGVSTFCHVPSLYHYHPWSPRWSPYQASWHFHKDCQINSQCSGDPFVLPKLQISWLSDAISHQGHPW